MVIITNNNRLVGLETDRGTKTIFSNLINLEGKEGIDVPHLTDDFRVFHEQEIEQSYINIEVYYKSSLSSAFTVVDSFNENTNNNGSYDISDYCRREGFYAVKIFAFDLEGGLMANVSGQSDFSNTVEGVAYILSTSGVHILRDVAPAVKHYLTFAITGIERRNPSGKTGNLTPALDIEIKIKNKDGEIIRTFPLDELEYSFTNSDYRKDTHLMNVRDRDTVYIRVMNELVDFEDYKANISIKLLK